MHDKKFLYKKPNIRALGFTLIELMLVVAIIGVLSLIALPKFAQLVRKSKEGATLGKLGALRSAIFVYYGDQEGNFPNDPTALTTGAAYIDAIPTAQAPPYHGLDSNFALTSDDTLDGSDGWSYNNVPGHQFWGRVWVKCTHTDSKNAVWTTY